MAATVTLLRRLAGTAVLAVCVGLAGLMLVPALLGYERYVIVSGSMTGTIDTGSIVYAKAVPTESLVVGDVITYAPPAGASPTELVTHRIASITPGPRGERVYVTKGDHNPAVDPWTFTLTAPTQAREQFHVPYVGYVFAALSVREIRMAVIGGPALLIALLTLAGLVRDSRRDAAGPVPGTDTPTAQPLDRDVVAPVVAHL
ncbi:signal peptidase I [Paraconexibacter sp.]|uniref:signal peptidase I n=1 Tax=Paraconexibacter sp. TaxID=2949640 RepID=UPI003562E309